MGVLMDDHLGKGFQRFSGRNNLRKDIDAIPIIANHLLDRLKLPNDFSQSYLQRTLFTGAVDMFGRGSHLQMIGRQRFFAKFMLGYKGGGGIVLQ